MCSLDKECVLFLYVQNGFALIPEKIGFFGPHTFFFCSNPGLVFFAHNMIIPIMREHVMYKENIFYIGLVFCAQYDHPNHAWPGGDECQNATGNVLLMCC